eukprot:52153-Prorocentrum_minimum.AAC.1
MSSTCFARRSMYSRVSSLTVLPLSHLLPRPFAFTTPFPSPPFIGRRLHYSFTPTAVHRAPPSRLLYHHRRSSDAAFTTPLPPPPFIGRRLHDSFTSTIVHRPPLLHRCLPLLADAFEP